MTTIDPTGSEPSTSKSDDQTIAPSQAPARPVTATAASAAADAFAAPVKTAVKPMPSARRVKLAATPAVSKAAANPGAQQAIAWPTTPKIAPAAKSTKPTAKAAARPAARAAVKPAPAVKAAVKPAVKAAVKPAVKAAVKPAVKAAVKPAVKAAVKPAVKAAVKPAVKAAVKGAVKPAAKAAVKPATKVVAKTRRASAAVVVAKDKVHKGKLVRDSFTMPEQEYAVLGQVKKACLKAGFEVKKSELLRIGVALISQIELATLQNVRDALPQLKTGRPKKT
jgi:hypothetical protein